VDLVGRGGLGGGGGEGLGHMSAGRGGEGGSEEALRSPHRERRARVTLDLVTQEGRGGSGPKEKGQGGGDGGAEEGRALLRRC
jgi:hypothetical protein